jgi:hypothetical protein
LKQVFFKNNIEIIGIIGNKYPSLKNNMISMGPEVLNNHRLIFIFYFFSPVESIKISSVETTLNWIKEIISEYSK